MVDLLSKDVFDLLLTVADSRTYTDMHCLLGNLGFEKGVGTIDMLFMDSPKVRAKGAGTLNLSDETLDVVINPEQKGRLFKKRSAVRISGALSNPSAATIPLAEAAELYAHRAAVRFPAAARGGTPAFFVDQRCGGNALHASRTALIHQPGSGPVSPALSRVDLLFDDACRTKGH